MRRRSSAILAADVVDYGRLMAEDEVGTHDRVKACLVDLIEPTILDHEGRIVRLIGDGVLVEFAEVAPAVACAVAIQRGMAARNAKVTRGRRILFRIGLNYGDVIVDGDGIYGNGVNVAVRLEALADPGGVFISGGAREQVRADASHRFASLGERPLKNVAEPVTVYRVVFDSDPAAALGDLSPPPPTALPATPLPPCPYRGLFAFREEDASGFFGREKIVDDLQAAVGRRSLVAVLGPSGSGKSSVVFAGLVPRLRAAGGWLIAAFRPERTPLRNLLAALLPLCDDIAGETALRDEIDAWEARFSDGRASLGELVDQILADNRGARRLLLIADQFEQIYTLVEDPVERERFLAPVLDLVQAADARAAPQLTLILTLRADFLGRLLTSRRLADALKDADVKLGPMTAEELRAAIENPARQQGVRFEMGLADRILKDVRGQAGGLPLLEFALTELWACQRHGRLTHVGYEEIGGVGEAIAGYAEEVYRRLAPPEQERVRQVFLQLVRPGEGTEDTGRVASRADIRDERWSAVDRLADARLVVTRRDEASGLDTAEVVHEALIREWQRLRRWVDGDREFLIWRQRLAEARKEWQAGARAEGYLLRAAPLAVALEWLARRGAELSDDDRDFIEASRVRLRREDAERERGRRRLLAGLAAATAVFFLVAAGAGYFWYDARQQKEIADRERDRSESLRVSAQRTESLYLVDVAAERLQSGDVEAAMLLALEALPEDLESPARPYVPAAEAALYRAVNVYRGTTALGRHDRAVWDGALSASGRLLATGADDGEVRLWRLPADGQAASFEVLGHHAGPVLSVRFLPDDRVLTTSADRTARLWPIDGSGAQLLAGHADAVVAGAFNPRSGVLATASWDGTARLWEAATGRPIAALRGHAASVVDVAFSPDGERLVTASTDGTARLWDPRTGRPLTEPLAAHQGAVWRALFSPDGAMVLTASADSTARLWDAATGAPRGEPLVGHQAGLSDAAFGPAPRDGHWVVVTASHDGTARLWDARQSRLLAVIEGHDGPIVDVAFSADGQAVATAARDHSVRLWDAQTGEQVTHTRRHAGAALWVALSPEGDGLVSGSEDGVVKLWDIRPGQASLVLRSPGGPIGDVAFSPDQRLLVTTAEEKTIPGAVGHGDYMPRLWDAATGAEVALLRGHQGDVYRAAFSPDGRLLVTAGDAQAFLWDLGALEPSQLRSAATILTPSAALPGHRGIVFDAEFDPAGQRVVTASADGYARIWTIEDGKVRDPPRVLTHAGQVRLATFSPDGTRLLTTTDDVTAMLWDAASGTPIGKELLHDAVVTHASFGATPWDLAHPVRIATAARDGEVRLWDGASGEPLQTLDAHEGFVTRALFSPDGRRLLTASMDKTARIWDTATGDPLVLLRGHTKGIYAAAFAPDGCRVATASYWDRTVRLWDTASGAPMAVFGGHSAGIKEVAFRPDGQQLVSASIDGTARVHDVLPQGAELIRLARDIVATEHLDLDPDQHRQLLSLHAGGSPSSP
jgi:WD40 repeat protein/class 3 adenylate cyclase